MNKRDVLKLNSVPEGKEPWLSYDDYHRLKRLFEAVPIPTDENGVTDDRYRALHRFLSQVAGLTLPPNEAAIHANAFTLIRRGYKVEDITPAEYARLRELMDGLAEPTPDDEDLYETGGHRVLYDYLAQSMGLLRFTIRRSGEFFIRHSPFPYSPPPTNSSNRGCPRSDASAPSLDVRMPNRVL